MALAINCDMGEGFGLYRCGDDEAIMPYITVANVVAAKQHGVKVGAHPSYPDLQGFGRREMKMDPEELTACIIYQVGALKGFLEANGMELNHIKPHGALYGVASRDETVANAVADAAEAFGGVPLMGMAGTVHEQVYTKRGMPFLAEYYTDLDYTDEGGLIITREHVAYDPEKAAAGAVRVITEGKAKSINGKDIPMRADCVCVHSDTPGAVELAQAVREALKPWVDGDEATG